MSCKNIGSAEVESITLQELDPLLKQAAGHLIDSFFAANSINHTDEINI